MTSKVLVEARCDSDKEVVILLILKYTDKASEVIEYILNNGESKEISIYDDRIVKAFERIKCK